MKEMIKKYWAEFQKGTRTMFKEFFNKETNKKQRANMWTFSRLALIIPILICSILAIITSSTPLLITNSLLVILGEITDIFDGATARKLESTSEYGKLLDQIVDKLFSTIVTITLTIINPLCIILLLGEGIIASSNIPYKMKYKNITDTSTIIGKIKQVPLSAAFVVGYLSPLNSSWHTISTMLTTITFLFQVATALSYLKRSNEWVKEYKKTLEKNNLVEIEEDFTKDHEKTKTKEIENKNNTVNNNISKKELYINLRNVLNQVIMSETNNSNTIELNNQKTKSIK